MLAQSYEVLNHAAELALARLSGVSGLVPSVDWLLYSAIRKEALLTSQIEGTLATLTDLFDEEAGLEVSNIAPRATGRPGLHFSSKVWRLPQPTQNAASSR